jgi:hypothetical protein
MKQSASHPFVRQDMLINPFMTDLDGSILAQPPRDLLRTPIKTQLGFDRVLCFPKDANSPVPVAIEGFEMGLLGSIASLATIPTQLPTYGGFMAANHSGYLCLVMTYFQQSINLVSLFLGKLRVAHKRSFDLAVSRSLSYRSLPLSTIKVALVS